MATYRGTKSFAQGIVGPLFQIPGLSWVGTNRRKSPTYGSQWVIVFEGTPKAIEEAFNLCPSQFTAQTDFGRGPVHRLTITTPDDPTATTNQAVTTTYELLGNGLQLDLREHPKSLALGYSVVRTIDAVIAQIPDPPGTRTIPSEDAIPAGDATTLYRLLSQRNGGGYVQKPQFVFRVSQIVGQRSTIRAGMSNLTKVHTTAQVIAETNPPSGILFSLNDATSAIAPATVPTGYTYGWLKQTPTVTLAAGSKMSIQVEYWLETWNTSYVYSTVS